MDPATRLTWSDGLYGGLIAGVVVSIFFMIADAVMHDPILTIYTFMASAVLGSSATNGGWVAVALGAGLLYLASALGGIAYAIVARRITSLARTPISTFAGFVYGFVVWLIFVDVIVPMTGMQQTINHPLWVSAVGIGFFYGSALCEYLANIARSRAARSS